MSKLFVFFQRYFFLFTLKLRSEKEKRKKQKGDGVLFEDYTLLSQRVDKMENSVGQINTKVRKLDTFFVLFFTTSNLIFDKPS